MPTLALIHAETKEATRAAFWEAACAGLIIQQESSYKFLHDRIQQAAYSMIPGAQRKEVHLRIGRMLFSGMTEDELAENLFDVANQFNRGAELLIDQDEKARVATIDLHAGRKAKASAAYAAADAYFSAGMSLLDESAWDSRSDLAFSLWRERAECELLTGDFDTVERLIGEAVATTRLKPSDSLHCGYLEKGPNPHATRYWIR